MEDNKIYSNTKDSMSKIINHYQKEISIIRTGRASKDIFIPEYPRGAYVDIQSNPIFQRNRDPKNFHHNFNEVLDVEKDLARQQKGAWN